MKIHKMITIDVGLISKINSRTKRGEFSALVEGLLQKWFDANYKGSVDNNEYQEEELNETESNLIAELQNIQQKKKEMELKRKEKEETKDKVLFSFNSND